jgi:hypothetical protein
MKWFFNPLEFIKSCTFYIGGDDQPEYVPIRPANVSTGFGTGRADPESGNYSYTLDPRLANLRDVFYNATNQFMPTEAEQQFAQGISNTGMSTFGRGNELLNQALALDPNQVGTDYYRQIQDMLSIDRAQEESRLADTLFKSGRTGAATGVQGGYLNPEQFAMLKARERANQELAINAEQLGRARREGDVGFASKLMGSGVDTYNAGRTTGMSPYQQMATLFGLGTNIEGLGLNANLGNAMNAVNNQFKVQELGQNYENARAENENQPGFFENLLSNAINAGVNYATGGLSGGGGLGGSLSSIWDSTSTIGGSLEGLGNTFKYGYGGVDPFAGVGGIENNPYLNWGR